MSNNLFPVFDVPDIPAETEIKKQNYKPAPLFDIEKGDFIFTNSRQIKYGSGYDAWVLWCTKTILTQRMACMSYGDYIGIEFEQALAEPDRKAAESVLRRTITEALLADPLGRTQYVRDFSFDWDADSLSVSCVCIGNDGDTAAIKARLRQ